MAIAVQMDYIVDLCKPVHLIQMDVPFFTGDKNAHRFHVKLMRNGCPVNVSGITATGYMVRADKQTVVWNGEADGCDIYLTMPASCYAVAGRFRLLLRVTFGDTIETALWVEGSVRESTTEVIVDPGTTLPSIEELLAQIAAMEQATAAANRIVEGIQGDLSVRFSLESDDASVIPDGTDFDTLMVPGTYKVETMSSGATMVNAPTPLGGRLTVMRTSQHDRLVQAYIANTDGGRIFWRLYDDAWSAWEEIARKSDIDSLTEYVNEVKEQAICALNLESDNAAILPDGTDFNDLLEPGNYKVYTIANAGTMLNLPIQTGGRLTVMRTSQHDRVMQIFVANMADPTIYIRMNDGAWSLWNKLAMGLAAGMVPDYYDYYLTTKARKINTELAAAGANGEGFVFITDIHEKPLHTPATMKRICQETNITKIINNGDVAKDKDTKAEVLPVLNKHYNLYSFPGCDLYKVVGNHEFNNGGGRDDYADRQLSADELHRTIFGGNANAVTIDSAGTLAYYFDDRAAKMRYFVCAVNYKSTLNYESINWIIAELENVPNDYDVVLFCHHGLNGSGEYTTFTARLVGALDAFKAHTTYTNDYNKVTYDYSAKSGEVICMCVGDEHKDLHKVSDGGVPIIATTCASVSEELGGLERVEGTVSESAYDVYVINRNTRKINVTRIGAGADREFTY